MKSPLVGFGLLALLLMVSTLTTAQTAYRWLDKDGKVHYSDQPPPQEIKKVEQRRIGAGSTIDTTDLPFATQKAAKDFPVTLYTAADCTAECKIAREFLNKRGVPFRESTIGGPDDAAAYRKAFGNDKLFLPSITVGSQKMQGYTDSGWNALLDDAGYARSAIPGSLPKNVVAPAAPAPVKANEANQQ